MSYLPTVRSAKTRQKKGQNRPVERISVTEMATRVENWLTEVDKLSDRNRQKSYINRGIFWDFFSIKYFSVQRRRYSVSHIPKQVGIT